MLRAVSRQAPLECVELEWEERGGIWKIGGIQIVTLSDGWMDRPGTSRVRVGGERSKGRHKPKPEREEKGGTSCN